MTFVLDASAAVEIVLRREGAKKFLDRLFIADKVISSDLYRAETASALSKYCRGGFLEKEEGLETLSFISEMVDSYIPLAENETEAFSEAERLNHSAYDMFYMTITRRFGATLLTCDKKLAAICHKEGLSVILAEYPNVEDAQP